MTDSKKIHKTIYGIYGASGFGREVLPMARKKIKSKQESGNLFFIDDSSGIEKIVNDHKVFSYEDFFKMDVKEKQVAISISDTSIKKKLYSKCVKDNIKLLSLFAENIVIGDYIEIGEGSILCHFVTITSNVKIGKLFHANLYSYVAHDCIIGDYVTFAPGVKCNGNVIIEDEVYVGAGAVIKQGTPDRPIVIGKGSVIGMGAVVTKNVPQYTTVIGNPARIVNN